MVEAGCSGSRSGPAETPVPLKSSTLFLLSALLFIGCSPTDEESGGDEARECSDGIDNDQNEAADYADPGCVADLETPMGWEGRKVEICTHPHHHHRRPGSERVALAKGFDAHRPSHSMVNELTSSAPPPRLPHRGHRASLDAPRACLPSPREAERRDPYRNQVAFAL